MIIKYTKRFKWKADMAHYPLQGYWYQLVSKNLTHSIYYNQFSELRPCNTFVEDNQLRISIDFVTEQEQENLYQYIYLYSLDLLKYSSISEVNYSRDSLLSQLAAIIDLQNKNNDDHVINQRVTCIFDLGYLPACSFKLNYGEGQVQVDHYNSDYVNKVSYYNTNLNDMLIDKESGLDFARVNLAYYKDEDLLGDMTIRKSGVVQL